MVEAKIDLTRGANVVVLQQLTYGSDLAGRRYFKCSDIDLYFMIWS
jgi:hypothetical protein